MKFYPFLMMTFASLINFCCSVTNKDFSYKILEDFDRSKFKFGERNIFLDYREDKSITYNKKNNSLITEVVTRESRLLNFTSDVKISGDEIVISYKRVPKANRTGVVSGVVEITLFKFVIPISDTSKSYVMKFKYPKSNVD
ncbi:MAG: hypothetical protein JWP69_1714 [Flaviaesturariibacter sp.]|nr:hypothetical protein [Flaviaesturariibacter sp.]